ncbi:DNA polymerase II [Candidatus Woesearchaeota archaeon]|jgi:DNA polymerase II|nr:DNA polymerase II [Candidatus Woesearchaeota archaeon]MBT5271707.1 DNA polymerase II [Candidatus Woesearchaeota archaeon]MBT6041103.1 DNA polymerase II [Candidatus Woesearchaeota archaeon]MBT6337428.1 DNA polymerase II [Candidatus Woesearchaeota archaeon]MBT7926911.1 DNA polymerase II [Candidatus Woesearchaeota archaeon]
MKAFIIYTTYRIIDSKAYVYLFGRLENNESFLSISLFRPYLWVKKKNLNKALEIAKKANILAEKGEGKTKNFDDEETSQIILDIPKLLPVLRKELEKDKIITYEADIRFTQKFMIDNSIKGITDISGKYKEGNFVNRIYEDPEFKEAKDYEPKLKVLSFDIETNEDASKLLSISLYTDDYKKVLIIHDENNKGKLKNAICFENEGTLLQHFKEKVIEIDPDILAGWNVIDFDLAVLRDMFKRNKIPFILGRTDWESKLRIQHDFFRSSSADIAGRQVLDGIELLRSAFISLPDYKLETAAQEILGKGKLITGNHRGSEIVKLYKTDPQKIVDYNLIDSQLVYDIFEKKKLVDLAIERSMLTGMQLDRVSGSIASLESLYLRETKKIGVVCPNSGYSEREERIKGGFVKESSPGIYDYILVLDFKSLYPSIIRTFNIDPLRFDETGKKGEITAPNKARFYKKPGILPSIIETLWSSRNKAKKRKDLVASHAIKITMNSFFGSLANPACRFFSLDMANAITSYGRYIVQETAKQVEEMDVKNNKYKVIYGDTDSIFVDVKAESLEDANKAGKKIQKFVNEYWESIVKDWYNMPSFLELEYEKIYKKFIMPKLRGTDKGAKKRYAGLKLTKDKNGKISEKMDFVGLEFVRKDWTDLAKEFQLELLDKVFHDKEVVDYVMKFVKDLKAGKHDKLLVYRKELRKPLEEYTKTTPPHVKAAKLLDKLDSTIIRYVVTENGPEPIQKLKSKVDYDHYINKQLKPIADSILVFFNQKFEELVSGKKQKSLFDY